MKENQDDPKAAEPRTQTEKEAKPEAEESPKAKGLKYEFKIAPVNPKNSFDFEDVADK